MSFTGCGGEGGLSVTEAKLVTHFTFSFSFRPPPPPVPVHYFKVLLLLDKTFAICGFVPLLKSAFD